MRFSLRKSGAATLLGAALVLAGGTGAAGAGAAPAPASPWSQTDYNAALSRANLTEKTLTATTIKSVRYLRGIASPLAPLGGGCSENTIVAPVLTGGSLYAVTNGRLSKYNPATGALIWRRTLLTPIGNESFSLDARSLSVAGGLVVVGDVGCDSVSDPNGYIQAFSASTGARAWSRPITPIGGALQQMGVSGSYIAASGTSPGSGPVVSVHLLTTGASVWFRTPACGGGPVLVVAQLVISYGCSQNSALQITARNIATGALAWSKTGNWRLQRGDVGGTAGHHLYATSPSGTVVSLDPLTGVTQYSLASAASVLAVDASRAYATCGSQAVCAYSTATGAQLWSAQVPAPFTLPALAAEAGGVLYLDQGQALNAATGTALSDLWFTNSPASALAVGDGRIAVVTDPRVLDLFGLPGS